MAEMLHLSLNIPVYNDEEAAKLLEAYYSGLLAELVRVGVLYGQFGKIGGTFVDSAKGVLDSGDSVATPELSQSNVATAGDVSAKVASPVNPPSQPKKKERIVLKADAPKTDNANASNTSNPTKANQGLGGRRRMGRV